MKLYNTLSRQVEDFKPLQDKKVAIYSCGPTVYDHIHIGNLSAFIAADTLRRALHTNGYDAKHVMNFTDVDDKTIRRSREAYPDDSAEEALRKLTKNYEQIFLDDMKAIGNDLDSLDFARATESIADIQKLIKELYAGGFAYIANDGVYFSIDKYKASGKTYGQLLKLDAKNTSESRINNDEYDKESAHDFALWKTRAGEEPAWEFELDGRDLLGRPGWHIECSAMSSNNLGQPFDIHTGGVDLIFPHHENEIAQSTAGKDNPLYAKYFVHNEHLLVDGKKMSKSLNNFYTLRDIQEKGYDPIAFRLMALQAHYRNQTNFSWDNLEAAQNRLQSLYAMADRRWQPFGSIDNSRAMADTIESMKKALQEDLNTPEVLSALSSLEAYIDNSGISTTSQAAFNGLLKWLEDILGLRLYGREDINTEQKNLIQERQKARDTNSWVKSDELRAKLAEQGITVRDTEQGPIWSRA